MKEIELLGDVIDNNIFENCRVIKEGKNDIVLIRNMKYRKITAKNINTLNEGDEYVVEECSNKNKYIVKPADTLASIAEKFGTSELEIMKNNKLNTSRLFVGQLLEL